MDQALGATPIVGQHALVNAGGKDLAVYVTEERTRTCSWVSLGECFETLPCNCMGDRDRFEDGLNHHHRRGRSNRHVASARRALGADRSRRRFRIAALSGRPCFDAGADGRVVLHAGRRRAVPVKAPEGRRRSLSPTDSNSVRSRPHADPVRLDGSF